MWQGFRERTQSNHDVRLLVELSEPMNDEEDKSSWRSREMRDEEAGEEGGGEAKLSRTCVSVSNQNMRGYWWVCGANE